MIYFHILVFLLFGSRHKKSWHVIWVLIRICLYGLFIYAIFVNAGQGQYEMMASCIAVVTALLIFDFRRTLKARFVNWRKRRAPVDYTKL